VKVRSQGRVVSVAVTIAVGVNGDGRLSAKLRFACRRQLKRSLRERREVPGMDVGPSEAEMFWVEFLRKPTRRGLRGVKLVSDTHEGLKAAITKILNATWQRCRVHFVRNALAHAGKQGRSVVSVFIGTALARDDAEEDVLAFMTFPKEHRTKLHSTNPIERLNGEIKRRTEVVGIFPNEEAVIRLVGAILLEQHDEWAVQRARHMTLETMASLCDDPIVKLPAWPPDAPVGSPPKIV